MLDGKWFDGMSIERRRHVLPTSLGGPRFSHVVLWFLLRRNFMVSDFSFLPVCVGELKCGRQTHHHGEICWGYGLNSNLVCAHAHNNLLTYFEHLLHSTSTEGFHSCPCRKRKLSVSLKTKTRKKFKARIHYRRKKTLKSNKYVLINFHYFHYFLSISLFLFIYERYLRRVSCFMLHEKLMPVC